MDDRERRLSFTPEDVAEATVRRRIELAGVDVESVHRTLEERLADGVPLASFEDDVRSALSTGVPGERAFEPVADERDERAVEADEGQRTIEEREDQHAGGDHDRSEESRPLEGRLSAVLAREEGGDAAIEYKPYGPHGAMAMVVGAIFALPTIFVSLLLVVVGYALYRIARRGTVPLERVVVVDVLVAGVRPSAADRAVEDAPENDAATVRVVAVAEPGYAVDATRLADLAWPHRKAIVSRVRDWKGLALEGERHRETIDDAFFGHLDAWWNRDAAADVDAVEAIQREVFAHREGRAAYVDRVRERAVEREVDDGADAARELERLLDGLVGPSFGDDRAPTESR